MFFAHTARALTGLDKPENDLERIATTLEIAVLRLITDKGTKKRQGSKGYSQTPREDAVAADLKQPTL